MNPTCAYQGKDTFGAMVRCMMPAALAWISAGALDDPDSLGDVPIKVVSCVWHAPHYMKSSDAFTPRPLDI